MMIFLLLFSSLAFAQEPTIASEPTIAQESSIAQQCELELAKFPGKVKKEALQAACAEAKQLDNCISEEGVRIFHYDRSAKAGEAEPKRILVFSLIHGDETPSGSVARSWMERLTKIEPRNYWRVVPILNPDGLKKKTRMNGRGVDINRNFPTSDWNNDALKYWAEKTRKDPRRYPGSTGGSEKETQCAIAHIDEFRPDLILAIHTPYGVLDFDGPKIAPPKFQALPWKNLGNFPGSLGRYMWVDRSKPTLTIELHGSGVAERLERFDRLQDITGDIAISAEKHLKKDAPAPKEPKP